MDNSTGVSEKVRKQVMHSATNMIGKSDKICRLSCSTYIRSNNPFLPVKGVLFTCIFFGLAARVAGERGQQFLSFFKSLAEVVLVLIRWFLMYVDIDLKDRPKHSMKKSITKCQNLAQTCFVWQEAIF